MSDVPRFDEKGAPRQPEPVSAVPSEALSDNPEPNHDRRYAWKLRYRLLVSKSPDRHAASPEAAGINLRRVVRGPHSEITEDEYHRGVAVMLEAASRTAA